MSNRRVVITGLGWVTSLGLDVGQVWKDLLAGTSGIRQITRWDASKHDVRFGGEVVNWDGAPNLDKRESKRLDRFTQFAMNAALDAVQDAGIDFDKEDPWRCGSVIGTGIGGIEEFEQGYQKMLDKGPNRISPFMVPKLMCNAAAGNVSIRWGIKGPNYAVVTACASAGHAIGNALETIRHGACDVVITGGSEAALTPLGTACFIALKALSRRNDDPQAASRPFDKERDGFILSEGAGVIVLEELEHAKARNARIYAELKGWGQSADGSHITAPAEDGAGAAHAMELALQDAGVNTTDIDYVNAHGTSTPLGDIAETNAIKRLFKDHAYKLAVSSTKSMTGHTLGASGGIEAIITCLALRDNALPPTINYQYPDEACDLDYVPNTARQKQVQVAMSNSFGFGGHNVSLVMGKI